MVIIMIIIYNLENGLNILVNEKLKLKIIQIMLKLMLTEKIQILMLKKMILLKYYM